MNSTSKVLILVMVAMVGMSGLVAGASVTADFRATPDDPYVGEQVSFDASTSSTDGTNITYEYDFDGDGTYDATGVTSNYTFESAGDHDVTVKVTDTDDGTTDTYTDTIPVHEMQSFDTTLISTSTLGNVYNLNVVIEGVDQSHDLITNGEFSTTLQEGSTYEVTHINSTSGAVNTIAFEVGTGNQTDRLQIFDQNGDPVGEATIDYSEEVASTGGSTTSDSGTDWGQLIAENIVVALVLSIVLTIIGLRGKR